MPSGDGASQVRPAPRQEEKSYEASKSQASIGERYRHFVLQRLGSLVQRAKQPATETRRYWRL